MALIQTHTQRAVGAPAQEPAALAAGLLVLGVLVAVDFALGTNAIITGSYVLAPFVAALLGTPRDAVIVGAFAVVAAAISGFPNDDLGETGWAVALTLVAGSVGLAAYAAAGQTRSRLSQARFELLRDLSNVADGAGGAQSAVDRILDLVVPALGDICTLDIVLRGEQRHLGARVAGPLGPEAEAALLRRRVNDPDRDRGTARAATRGEDQLVTNVTPDLLQTIAATPQDLELLLRLPIRSAMFIALRARGLVIGALAVAVGPSGRRFTSDDFRFARTLAGRIALALDASVLSQELVDLERQLDLALSELEDAIVVSDAEGRVLYANPAAAAMLGAPVGELYSQSLRALVERLEPLGEDGRRLTADDLPGQRVLAGDDSPEPLLMRSRAGGEERWLLNKVSAVRDSAGQAVRVVNVIEDITEVKREELRSRLLARAGEVLASSMDYQATLQQVAEMAIESLGDWCAVSMPDGQGYMRTVAVAHADPAKVQLARQLNERYPTRVDAPGSSGEVLLTGVPQVVNDIPQEMLEAAAQDEEHLRILRELGLCSGMSVPMVYGGSAIGVISLVSAESERRYSEHDAELALELARRAATAVENARLYTERTRTANSLAAGLMPPDLPQMPGWEAAAFYRPAGRLAEVGGDFYDAFQAEDGEWMVLIGDVTGHGPEAATLAAAARYTLRTAAEVTRDPVVAAERLNAALRARPETALVTAICLRLTQRPDGGALATMAVCGHPLPLVRRGQHVEEAGDTGVLAGAFDDARWAASSVELRPGDTLLLFTDGVLDAKGADGDRFGDERLRAVLAGSPPGPGELLAELERELRAFQQGAQLDDAAAIALRLT